MKKHVIYFETVFNNLRQAIEASNEAYGLEAFDKSEFVRREKMHKTYKIDKYYLDETGAIWYMIDDHMNKFSWYATLHNGKAALVLELTDSSMIITDHVYDRNQLRGSGHTWTTEYYAYFKDS